MAIDIDKRFTVKAPPDTVWAYLTDPRRVAECLPGATITDQDGMTYMGAMKVKLGPVSSTYEGKVHFDHMNVDTYTAELSAEGRDTRGKGTADMTMRSVLGRSGAGTEVRVTSSVNVTGVLAQLGRGMVEDVSDQLFQQFTTCMKATLEAEAQDGEADIKRVPAETPQPTGKPNAPLSGSLRDVLPDAKPGAAHAEPTGGSGSSTLRASASPTEKPDALDLGAVGSQAAARAGKRMLTRPAFWIVLAVLGVLGWIVTQ